MTKSELQKLILERYPRKTRKREFGKVPTGYKINQIRPTELLPDEEIIEILEELFDRNEDGESTRKLSQFLLDEHDIKISYVVLANLYNEHRKPFTKRRRKRHIPKVPKTSYKKRSLKANIVKDTKKYNELVERERKKKIEKELLKNPKTQRLDFSVFETPKEEATIVDQDDPTQQKIFSPNPGPQSEFLECWEQEVLYGGSAGGGKSYAMLADPMRYFGNPNFRGLLLRRTNDELRELKFKAHELYPKAFKGAKWSERESQWRFPSGATLWFTYLERDEDVMRYQGQAFTWIGFDELTQYPTPYPWDYLRSRLRTTDPTLPLFMRATTNPGGVGHHWVKKMFIDPAPPNTSFNATDSETGEELTYPDGTDKAGQPLFQRKFIPASLYDNPYLTGDGAYERNLLSLPEHQRERLLYGNWDVVAGAAFAEFNKRIHVCEPFEIPDSWYKFRSCDFGYSSNSAVLWLAVDPAFGTLYVYREYYTKKETGVMLGRSILNIERDHGERISYGILDSSTWHQRGQRGPSIAEDIRSTGCRFIPSDRSKGSRVDGKNRIHELLRYDEEIEKPGLIIFDSCRQLLKDIQSIPSDPRGGEDIDDRYPSDHTYDALRYAVMSRPDQMTPRRTDPFQTNYTPASEVFGY